MQSLDKLLVLLHEETVKGLLEKIQSGEATSADYNAAINLLKHNRIAEVPKEPDSPLVKLDKSIADAMAEEFGRHGTV